MKIFPPPLEIGDEEGFAAGKDIFQRASLGAGLTTLVGSVLDPMVIALDSQWGSGKTTFLKMWAGELRKAGFPVVLFDAFESDYIDDAFIAIAGEIIALADQFKKADTPKAKRFAARAFDASKVLARSSLKVAVKVGTAGAIDLAGLSDELSDAVGDIASEASNLADKHLGELLTKQRDQKETLQAFRDALSELPSLLAPPSEDQGAQSRPLVIIIDELDRCRPLFALQLLERVKHFFSVPNVHFVLGVHLGQLRNSVRAAYGGQIDAQTYLQKFIHLTLTLPERDRYRHTNVAEQYIQHLTESMQFPAHHRDVVQVIAVQLIHIAHYRGISLRSIERILTVLALALAFVPKGQFMPEPILGGLCYLKVVEPDLYAKAKRGILLFQEAKDALALDQGGDRPSNYNPTWHE
jgi:predicted KAP-like P-loop ATPase